MTGSSLAGLGLLLLAAPALAQIPSLPSVDIRSDSISGPLNQPHLRNVHVIYGGELTLDADQADGDLKGKKYTLRGHVRAHETDTTIQAGTILFDSQAGSATAADALLTQKVFTIRSKRIEATPELITAAEGDFATVPPDETPDFHLHAQTITLDQKSHRGTLRNVKVYLLHTHVLTVPRISFRIGGGGNAQSRRQILLPSIGASARYGTFVAFGSGLHLGRVPVQYRLMLPTRQSVEAALTSQQTLITVHSPVLPVRPRLGPVTLLDRIRAFATVPPGLLPEGDPLLFHDFLPDRNPIQLFDTPSRGELGLSEDLSVHIASQGRNRDDLYVSRLPEVTLSGQLPLSRIPEAPPYGDAKAFRDALRRPVFYADAQETVGDYREQPTNTRARRVRTQVGLSARPLLIAPNTVILPRLSVSTSGYSGSKKAYRYNQFSLAVNHYFSDLTAVGIQYLASSTSGDSPFNFDVLDTSRELDVRLQLGSRHLTTASRVRFDLTNSRVIDYQLALAPMLHGLTPVFSYNFRTRSLGAGIEIKGITF